MFLLIVLSSAIMMYAICKQFNYINSFKKDFAFDNNKFTFYVHALLLLLQTPTNFFYCYFVSNLFYDFQNDYSGQYTLCKFFLIVMDFCIQLCILQICWQLGGLPRPIKIKRIASVQLDLIISDNETH